MLLQTSKKGRQPGRQMGPACWDAGAARTHEKPWHTHQKGATLALWGPPTCSHCGESPEPVCPSAASLVSLLRALDAGTCASQSR